MIGRIVELRNLVVLRATIAGAWMLLMSRQFARADDAMWADTHPVMADAASWLVLGLGAGWIVLASSTAWRRGMLATTWSGGDHRFGTAASVLFAIASIATMQWLMLVMAAMFLYVALADMAKAESARALVARHGLEKAAIVFEHEAGSRDLATRRALDLLSVRDETGDDLAYEVLCSIRMPDPEPPENGEGR